MYKMYTVLKLYYLHQQELLNQVLALLKEHIHSAQLAETLRAYIGTMQGANAGWVAQMEALLKSHIKMYTGDMAKLIVHQRLVHHLHTLVYHAAAHNGKQISRMFSTMRRHGFAKYSLRSRHHLFKRTHRIFHKIRHVFRTHTATRVHRRTIKTYSFRSSHSSSRTTRHMVKTMGTKKTLRVLKKVLKKAHSAKTVRHVKRAITKVSVKRIVSKSSFSSSSTVVSSSMKMATSFGTKMTVKVLKTALKKATTKKAKKSIKKALKVVKHAKAKK
jgi:hypothetical protein